MATLAGIPTRTGATMIVGYRTETEIVVGADSKMVGQDADSQGRLTTPIPRPDQCKLVRLDDGFYVGLAGDFQLPGLDIGRLLVGLAGATPRAELVTMSAPLLAERYVSALNGLRAAWVRNWKRPMPTKEAGTFVFEALFFGRESGTFLAHGRRYYVEQSDPVHLGILAYDCPKDCRKDANGGYLFYTGDVAWMDMFLNENPRYVEDSVRDNGAPMTIRFLLGRAMAARPTTIGPPVSIIRIRAHGWRWIECGECGDDEQCRPTPTPQP